MLHISFIIIFRVLPLTCLLCTGKHANVLGSFCLKGNLKDFRSDHLNYLTVCLVASRTLYVWTKEKCCCTQYFYFIWKSHTQYPPLVLHKEHTDLPFNVKAQTWIPKKFADPRVAKQLLPTMSTGSSFYVCRFFSNLKSLLSDLPFCPYPIWLESRFDKLCSVILIWMETMDWHNL